MSLITNTAGVVQVIETYTGGDTVYHTLRAAGVDCVFGIPSQQNLGLYDALCRHGGIRVVGTRHEQGAIHAADGYARATGRLGVAIVSTGPGTANAMSGLYEAGFASSRVLLITTQVDTKYLGKGKGYIHDAEGQAAMLRSVTRTTELVRHAEDIGRVLQHVITEILTGRPQPGAIEIPSDLLITEIPEQQFSHYAPLPQTPLTSALDSAVEQLSQARRPLLWVGGGCASAASELRQLAEKLSAPVVSSINGRGVMPHGHALYVGCQTHLPEFNELLAKADVVLAVGTRFQAFASQYWQQPMPAKLIHLDVDPGVIGRNYQEHIALVGDAALGLEYLLARLDKKPIDREFTELAEQVSDHSRRKLEQIIGQDHQQIADIINRLRPSDSAVVGDATVTVNTWGHYRLAFDTPRLAHYVTGLAIGPALPLAIGAAIGTGNQAIAIHGDGGVMLNIAEIATAVQEQAPVVLCVFNDQGYGVLRGLQRISTGREYAVDLHTPDFIALAKAMGMPGERVESVAGFEQAFQHAIGAKGPFLIEIDLTKLEPIRMFD